MSVERATMAFAGLMVLLSVALTIWINDNFIWFTVFIGANLLQSAYTQFCPAAIILRKMGFQSEAQLATAEH
ncbi:DUF2892 domain-containing protein [Shewanella sp. 1CM18E]|uniref:YgaP family membrane protein n=1 Tax=Shewanella sp. 1CM18E TaxID=2929169 RepID=UPI0020BDB866|nr:DUF2892 domain-containing protein [Shewanella sp. 1CM18E]MCK8044065.1 DUF2892 domain-containing protein [Shewanella sp. 1CM18E]